MCTFGVFIINLIDHEKIHIPYHPIYIFRLLWEK